MKYVIKRKDGLFLIMGALEATVNVALYADRYKYKADAKKRCERYARVKNYNINDLSIVKINSKGEEVKKWKNLSSLNIAGTSIT